MATLEVRFWAKVDTSGNCWTWTGAGSDYGQIWAAGRPMKAHRVSWELAYGPIPEGLCVLHRCDNPPCVRPEHLFLGTVAQNNQDRARKDRGNRDTSWATEASARRQKERKTCPHGHPLDEANTWVHPTKGWRQCRACDRISHQKRRSARA